MNGNLSDFQRLKELISIGIALSSEKDAARLQEMILEAAQKLTLADGGTLYIKTPDDKLKFEILHNKSLNVHSGGTSGQPVTLPPLHLHDIEGKPNLHMVAVCAVLTGKTINIPDAYETTEFEFSGTRQFDQKTGYRSKAFLTVPMKDRDDQVIGVLQLINPIDPATREIRSFSQIEQELAEFLAAQAGVALIKQRLTKRQERLLESLRDLNRVGVALSSEKNEKKLLQMVLEAAKKLTNADGGTLYLHKDNGLAFEIMLSTSLNIHRGGTSGEDINYPPLPLYDGQGKPNKHMVAVCAALNAKTINIPDAYENTEFEFSGTRSFDQKTNYRSKSFLTVPIIDYQKELIGVLQLINATEPDSGQVLAFNQEDQQLVESLASQAGVAIVNQRLIEQQRKLFESMIQLIADAIDRKSPYTGGHCKRVPELTLMIADAVASSSEGAAEIQQFEMTDDDRYELWVAGMLHDCGKITTPEYVVDKGTKLETIYDRIKTVDARFEVLKRDAEICFLKKQISSMQHGQVIDIMAEREKLSELLEQLDDERNFLRKANIGGEFMAPDLQERVKQIAQRRWINPEGQEANLLDGDEIYNLNIAKGTLTQEERRIINNHIVATIEMLEALPYPKYLKRVPEYAGGHHERMDGKGYPRGLKRDQMSIPARIMAIADVFEALTASDRPYKKAMPLSVALKILSNMKQEGHIDPDIFDIFVREEVYLDYAGVFLPDEQIDIGEGKFDVTTLPGYNPNLPARKKIRLKRKTRQVAPPSTPPAKSPGNRA